MDRVEITPNGCWEWRGCIDLGGYGVIGVGGKPRKTHRVTYELIREPIPEGLHLDHLCRNRCCCNPWHLEPVTPRENTLRGESINGKRSRQTHCLSGHEFTPENTQLDKNNNRHCKKCIAERSLAVYHSLIEEKKARRNELREKRREGKPRAIRDWSAERIAAVGDDLPESVGLGGRQLEKTHCPKGHPYSGDNLHFNPKGWRVCRACQKAHSHEQYQKRKAQQEGP